MVRIWVAITSSNAFMLNNESEVSCSNILRFAVFRDACIYKTQLLTERRRLRADLILAFKIFKGEVDLNPSEFFLRLPRVGLRGHTYRLLQGPSRLRRRSGAFSVRVVKYWNRIPAHLVSAPSVSIFKKTVRPSLVRNRPCSTCVTSVPIH